jgi:hypothetical protein
LTPNTTYYYRVRAYNSGGTSGNSNVITVTTTAAQVATPTFSPPGATYCASAKNVTISTATSGASIRYTTDGTTPTASYGTPIVNGGTVLVTFDVTGTNLKAIAYKSGMTNSAVRSDWYYYDCGQSPQGAATPKPETLVASSSSETTATRSTSTPAKLTADGRLAEMPSTSSVRKPAGLMDTTASVPNGLVTFADAASAAREAFIRLADKNLTSASVGGGTGPTLVVYDLDKAGNRNSVSEDGLATNYTTNNLNQYSIVGADAVVNGSEHEITSYAGVSYTYINDEHLKTATYGINTYDLAYDALGRCVKRTLSSSTLRILFRSEFSFESS